MKVMGIDLGKQGGLCVIEEGKILQNHVMPMNDTEYDIGALINIFKYSGAEHIFVEKSQAMPRQGVKSMWSIGFSEGLMLGIISVLQIPYTLVRPMIWMKVVFAGMPKQKDKSNTMKRVCELFPTETFLASSRCRVKHEGLCDAALLAWYGERFLNGVK